ncbi:hypothetical protein RZ760_010480 [Providencia rettgeri]|nr:hypothetical protein [Providencia rettgeri]
MNKFVSTYKSELLKEGAKETFENNISKIEVMFLRCKRKIGKFINEFSYDNVFNHEVLNKKNEIVSGFNEFINDLRKVKDDIYSFSDHYIYPRFNDSSTDLGNIQKVNNATEISYLISDLIKESYIKKLSQLDNEYDEYTPTEDDEIAIETAHNARHESEGSFRKIKKAYDRWDKQCTEVLRATDFCPDLHRKLRQIDKAFRDVHGALSDVNNTAASTVFSFSDVLWDGDDSVDPIESYAKFANSISALNDENNLLKKAFNHNSDFDPAFQKITKNVYRAIQRTIQETSNVDREISHIYETYIDPKIQNDNLSVESDISTDKTINAISCFGTNDVQDLSSMESLGLHQQNVKSLLTLIPFGNYSSII